MSAAWQTKPIGEIFRVVNGGTPKTGNPAFWDGEHYWITPAEMGGLDSPYLAASRRTLTDEGLRVGAELVPENSIILSSRAPIGHLVINEVPMAFNQGCKGLVPEKGIDAKFAYYFLLHNVPLLESLGTGATFKELSGGKLKEVLFHFPPLADQHRIVAILDEAFAGIAAAKANAEQNRRNARAVFESYLNAVFSTQHTRWEEVRISALCDIKHGYAFDGAEFSKNVQEGNPLVATPGNFTEDAKLVFDQRNTKRFRGEVPAGFTFNVGDLAVVMTDLSSKMKILGKPAFVRTENVLHNQRIGRVVFNSSRIDSQFLYYFFLTERYLKSIKASATGTMVKHTAPKRILGNVIRFPPKRQEQRSVIVKLNAVREETQHLESLYTRKLAALDELKQSLLHQAFSGAL